MKSLPREAPCRSRAATGARWEGRHLTSRCRYPRSGRGRGSTTPPRKVLVSVEEQAEQPAFRVVQRGGARSSPNHWMSGTAFRPVGAGEELPPLEDRVFFVNAIAFRKKATMSAFRSTSPSRTRRSGCPGSRRCCSPLRPEELVAPEDHRGPGREEQQAGVVLRQPPPQPPDFRVVRLPFRAAVPGVVVVRAVPVPFEIRFVVLPVEGDQVAQGEPFVAGDEVDAVVGGAPVVAVQVGTDPVNRKPRSRELPAVPLTNLRAVSRNRPFHSDSPRGIRHLVRPEIHGSAMSLVFCSTGPAKRRRRRRRTSGTFRPRGPARRPGRTETRHVHHLAPVPKGVHHQPDRRSGR